MSSAVYVESDFTKILDTAKFPSYLRALTNIPKAKDVYNFLIRCSPNDSQKDSGLDYESFKWLAPLTEARSSKITKLINLRDYDLVLELGSGFSLRWLQTNEFRFFADTDQLATIELKRKMIGELGISVPNSLILEELNPFKTELTSFVDRHTFGVKRIALIHEGFAQYFTRDELKVLAANISALARKFEVEWITPDFSTITQYEAYISYCPQMLKLADARTKATGRNLTTNAFENLDSIENFLKYFNFHAEWYPLLEDWRELSSIGAIADMAGFIEHFYHHLKISIIKTI